MSETTEAQGRRAALYDQWGKPAPVAVMYALGLLGEHAVPGSLLAAFRYGSAEAAEAYRASNREHNGLDSV